MFFGCYSSLKNGCLVILGRRLYLGPPTPTAVPEDGQLKSEVMVKENRRYYLDLKENNRGRFLRVFLSSYLKIRFLQPRVRTVALGFLGEPFN